MARTRRIHGPRALRIVGNVFMMLGLIGLLVAGSLALLEHYSGRSASADGVIIGFGYGPVVQFTAQNGEVAQFDSPVRSSFLRVGEHLPVAYAPDDPSDAEVDGFVGRWFLPGLFGLLAGVFLLVGLGLAAAGQHFKDAG